MILHYTQLLADHNSTLLSVRTSSICLLQMEPQDSFQAVLHVLQHQIKPVLLLLPTSGDAFSQPEHFVALRHLLLQRELPPFLCLIITPERTNEVSLAIQHQIQSTPTIEDALTILLHSTPPHHKNATGRSSAGQIPPTTNQMMETHGRVQPPPLQTTFMFTPTQKKRHALLVTGMLALLLAASAMIVPLLLFTPSSGTTTVPLGTLSFGSSGQGNPDLTQGYNDLITFSLRGIPAPPAGMRYYIWLMPDPGDETTPPLLIDTLSVAGPVNMTYTSPEHTNLLASYSGVRVTVQSSTPMPETPSNNPTSWQWQGFLPNTPTPGDENHASFLSHIQDLLAKDPTLQANQIPGGLAFWLTHNVSKVEEWASAAQGNWYGVQTSDGDAEQIHHYLLHILEYLDGARYYTRDVPSGSPWLVDPIAGKIGLLNSVQNQKPPGFLEQVDAHLMGLAGAPGHTSQQQHLVILVDTVIMKMRTDLLRIRNDAAKLVKLNTRQLQQQGNNTTFNEMTLLTTEMKYGWFDPNTRENTGGILWITSHLQQIATLPVSA